MLMYVCIEYVGTELSNM